MMFEKTQNKHCSNPKFGFELNIVPYWISYFSITVQYTD